MKLIDKAKLLLQKVYTVSKKHEMPRLWLQSIVCEAAGLKPGSQLYVSVDEENKRIVLQNTSFGSDEELDTYEVSVSSRKNRISQEQRPLVDTCGAKYSSILSIQDKIEISVYRQGDHSQIVVKPLRFRLFETDTYEPAEDERIRLLSIGAGAGVGTSIFCDSQYFSSIQEIELEDDSAEVLRHNYPHSFVFNGDLRDCHVVAKADVAFVSLDCSEHSVIGDGRQGYFRNLVLGTYKLLKAAECRAVFLENVPQFYESQTYRDLEELLSVDYPYLAGPVRIDSYDYGSIAHRDRTYAVFFKEQEDFDLFNIPKPPRFRRFKLKDYLDPSSTQHQWKPLKKWMDSFQSKAEKNNAWADRNIDKTFVTPDCKELYCIPKRYRSHSANNSYVLSDDGDQWRFLTISELCRIFNIPSWFSWPKHIPVYRQAEQIGQSVCGLVISAFSNELASMFFRRHAGVKRKQQMQGLSVQSDGQIGLVFS